MSSIETPRELMKWIVGFLSDNEQDDVANLLQQVMYEIDEHRKLLNWPVMISNKTPESEDKD